MLVNGEKANIDDTIVLSEVLGIIPSYVFWKDKELIFRGCNLQFAQQFGCKEVKEIIGKTDEDFPWSQNELKKKYKQDDAYVINTGESLLNIEEEQLQVDGSIRTLLVSKVPLKNGFGDIIGILGTYVDITYLKNTEKSLRDAKEKAEAANRAKTEFLSNMSHDVKTPMTGVVSVADLMRTRPDWRTADKAEMIYSCGLQVLKFFNSCLELSKLEIAEWAAKEEEFSLQTLLNEVQTLFVPRAQSKGLDFSMDYGTNLPTTLVGHRGSVYRVVLNLVGNALKFTEKGKVHVRAFLAEPLNGKNIHIGIEVTDTGVGIPKDKQEIIFEKLQRLTPSYEGKVEGSGIGLYIVDQYVKHMNGTVSVKSELGQGSTFTVFLPMILILPGINEQETLTPAQEVISSIERVTQEKVLAEKAPRILLVEDNPVDQMVTKSLLNEAGFSVDVAGTGAEAIEAFSPGKYGLIYMDIGLPDIDGYQVTQAMREKEKTAQAIMTPIVALTGHAAIDVKVFCEKVGIQGVLSKPITREQAGDIWKRYGKGESIQVAGLTVL